MSIALQFETRKIIDDTDNLLNRAKQLLFNRSDPRGFFFPQGKDPRRVALAYLRNGNVFIDSADAFTAISVKLTLADTAKVAYNVALAAQAFFETISKKQSDELNEDITKIKAVLQSFDEPDVDLIELNQKLSQIAGEALNYVAASYPR